MWFNQKSSYFLDTFGNRSRYLSKLISGNSGSTLLTLSHRREQRKQRRASIDTEVGTNKGRFTQYPFLRVFSRFDAMRQTQRFFDPFFDIHSIRQRVFFQTRDKTLRQF